MAQLAYHLSSDISSLIKGTLYNSPRNYTVFIVLHLGLHMMPCTSTKKAQIWALHQRCFSMSEIQKEVSVSKSIIHRTIQELSLNLDIYAKKPRSGRPRILTQWDLRHASLLLACQEAFNASDLQCKAFLQVSAWTMRHNLAEIGLKGYVWQRKPFLSPAHKKTCKWWAEHAANWSSKEWNGIVFSDESKFNLFGSDGRQYCKRKQEEEFLSRNVQKKIKYGRGSIMVWGCIT
jgi:transposase